MSCFINTCKCNFIALVAANKSVGYLVHIRVLSISARILCQGLRLNRVLVALDLSGNQVGDAALVAFGELVTRFALTHEEVVQRRAMLSLRKQAASSRGARTSSAHLSFAAMSALLRSVVRCVLRFCFCYPPFRLFRHPLFALLPLLLSRCTSTLSSSLARFRSEESQRGARTSR